MNIAAFDIGGTALKMGVITTDGKIVEKGKVSVNECNGEQVLQAILQWLATHPQCEGIAISAPGYVNPHTGFIEMGGAIRCFDNFDIKSWLQERTHLPVAIENDANCVLLAERWQGKAAAMTHCLVVTIGTGIGGAILCNNQLVHGARFRAGEFGYMVTEHPGPRNIRRYTMNETCTLRILRQHYADHAGLTLNDVTGEDVFALYDSGDLVCQRLVDDFLNNLGVGLYNLVNLFDPQTIFIGGGIVERPGFLALLRKHLTWFGIEQSIDSVSHGNDAGLIGAVYHFNQQFNPS